VVANASVPNWPTAIDGSISVFANVAIVGESRGVDRDRERIVRARACQPSEHIEFIASYRGGRRTSDNDPRPIRGREAE